MTMVKWCKQWQGFGQTNKHCWWNIWNLLVKQHVWPFAHVTKHRLSNIFCCHQEKNVFKLFQNYCTTNWSYFSLTSNVLKRLNIACKGNHSCLTTYVWSFGQGLKWFLYHVSLIFWNICSLVWWLLNRNQNFYL